MRGHTTTLLDFLGAEVQAWEVHSLAGLRALGLVAKNESPQTPEQRTRKPK